MLLLMARGLRERLLFAASAQTILLIEMRHVEFGRTSKLLAHTLHIIWFVVVYDGKIQALKFIRGRIRAQNVVIYFLSRILIPLGIIFFLYSSLFDYRKCTFNKKYFY
jgi:hypothetical protein